MIRTDRLLLRPLSLNDARDVLEYQSNPDVVRFTPWPVRDIDAVIAGLEKLISLHKDELQVDGDSSFFAWELLDENKVIGQSNLTLASVTQGTAEIGWATSHKYQGQGFAFEATSALIKYTFETTPTTRILAKIDSRNFQSIKLARKLGMEATGTSPEMVLTKGELCEMHTFEISVD